MEQEKIYWRKAWELIKISGAQIKQEQLEFTQEPIPWYIVQDLNDAGLRVPKDLIDYEDDKIDYTDHPSIDELLKDGSYKQVFTVKFDNEIANWLKESKIDYNVLINDYLKTVYQSIKTVDNQGYLLQP